MQNLMNTNKLAAETKPARMAAEAFRNISVA